ncbi:MAG: sigma-70 family RNA polymerase sigma factor [Planctomycetia bacterium]|nr:sigma-70 family RNA polymerase sigma factor [Planctomycetia bacterium]
MTSGQLNQVLRQLCRLVGVRSVEELGDRQLLEAFAKNRDAAAFEVLVQRHGPLVMGVCKRVLHEEHDAEDVFQATFMVLARKADSIRRQEAVGSWLCGTAYRLALKARAAAGRRREQERQAGQMASPPPEPDPHWQELRPVLDEELNRLPDKYRAPLVLCYLQGKTNEVAAKELGWPVGSISYRLSQAREKLRVRLLERGIVLSSAALPALLAENASAAVQGPLIDATVTASLAFAAGEAAAVAGSSAAAVALAEAGVQAILFAKAKAIALACCALIAVTGTVGVTYHVLTRGPSRPTEVLVVRDPTPRLRLAFSQSQRFGIVCTQLRDPLDPERWKRLTREENGLTNNTCFRIDGLDYLFGVEVPGVRWARDRNNKPIRDVKLDEHTWQAAVEVLDQGGKPAIRITQTVQLIRGEMTGLLDTVLVRYDLLNLDVRPHTVGLRFMLDTLIGGNDGVPFLIPPGEQSAGRLLDSMEIFNSRTVPAFIRAIETDKLEDRMATVAELNLKLQGYEPLDRLVICRWPDNSEIRWDWDFRPMNEVPQKSDSCAVLYWAQQSMRPQSERRLAFTYGLGQIYGEGFGGSAEGGFSPREDGRLRLLTAGSSKMGNTFTATAYVKGDKLAGQKIRLELPAGLTLAAGQSSEQFVPKPGREGYSQVSWRVRSTAVGRHALKVDLLGFTAERQMQVTEKSLFD